MVDINFCNDINAVPVTSNTLYKYQAYEEHDEYDDGPDEPEFADDECQSCGGTRFTQEVRHRVTEIHTVDTYNGRDDYESDDDDDYEYGEWSCDSCGEVAYGDLENTLNNT